MGAEKCDKDQGANYYKTHPKKEKNKKIKKIGFDTALSAERTPPKLWTNWQLVLGKGVNLEET